MVAHSSCRAVPEQLVLCGVGVWSEVSVLIHPTGVLWDSVKDFELASPFLKQYCPQAILSQTLFRGMEHCHANIDNRYQRTGLLL
jgi:hypothetical protein